MKIKTGKPIASKIDLGVVLAHRDRCASLRSLVAWTTQAPGPVCPRFQLFTEGQHTMTTTQEHQLPVMK